MDNTSIGGKEFSEMLLCGAKNLALHRVEVNDLNVFPIPDGDTGDNMLMTFSSGADAAATASSDLGSAAQAASSGMLLGARGNSGVILSRIFAGLTRELYGLKTATLSDIKRGMNSGVKEAYQAVSKPVEGTILTVLKDAVNYGETFDNGTIAAYFKSLTKEMARSLEKTPELLSVLMDAGVVDSGGAGLLYIFEGMKNYLTGEIVYSNDTDESAATEGHFADVHAKNTHVDFSLFTADTVLEFGYCTEFILRLQNFKTDISAFDVNAFIKKLEDMGGESIVAFKEDSILKVHVHTKTPGNVFNLAQNYGEFLTLKVENMTFQNSEALNRGNNAQTVLKNKRKKKDGFVVVASGEGIVREFYALGADAVVEGGQSMNPSAQDFIAAFYKANARRIFVFPNNSNVILTAKQAANLYNESEIVVIESKSVGECYAALSLMQTSGDSESIKSETEQIISEIVTAYVSPASRNADISGVEVKQGDYIGFVGNDVYCDFTSRDMAARTLISRLSVDDYGVLIIFYGGEVPFDEAEKLRTDIAKSHKNLEVILLCGGQPVYDYMFVLE